MLCLNKPESVIKKYKYREKKSIQNLKEGRPKLHPQKVINNQIIYDRSNLHQYKYKDSL